VARRGGEPPLLIIDATYNGQPPGDTFEGDDGAAAAVTYWIDASGSMSGLAGAVIKDNPWRPTDWPPPVQPGISSSPLRRGKPSPALDCDP
jgi:hypothetical protein